MLVKQGAFAESAPAPLVNHCVVISPNQNECFISSISSLFKLLLGLNSTRMVGTALFSDLPGNLSGPILGLAEASCEFKSYFYISK